MAKAEAKMGERRGATQPFMRPALWCGVVLLSALGVVAAAGRVAYFTDARVIFEQVTRLFPPAAAQEMDAYNHWFRDHRLLTFLHVVPGGILLALGPFQFSSRLRARHLRLHRRAGRVAAVAALLAGASGLLLGAVFPYGGPLASSAIFVFGTLFLVSLARAVVAVRRGDVAGHREWMLRMYSVGASIATIRVIAIILYAATGASPVSLLGPSFWLGFSITYAAAEFWIRHTRTRPAAVRRAPLGAAGA